MLGYNRMTGYNKARYNAEGTEIAKADSFSLVDNTVTKTSTKRLAELITTSESTAKQQNKQLSDTVKLDVWLSIDRKDSSKWSD